MYATVRNYAGPERFAEELVKRQDEVKGLIQGISGFRAYYMVRTDEGGAVSISVYDDQAGAEESTRQAADWVRTNLPDLGVSPPQVSSVRGRHPVLGARLPSQAQATAVDHRGGPGQAGGRGPGPLVSRRTRGHDPASLARTFIRPSHPAAFGSFERTSRPGPPGVAGVLAPTTNERAATATRSPNTSGSFLRPGQGARSSPTPR
jgi:hypothetical protein